ncbi:MAG: 6,7-dimethyl-8-ribityllumazine synthase [Gemmatimonadetes bacterium GWC2_71_10]|nr:MAG: 6,7-dimethyl-8-ribityllumazine synthase [Gemmatimonadetes bacterium GWC2_71_10]
MTGRVGIVVSRYHEAVTTRLLDGARASLAEHGVADVDVDVVWVAGAWELPVVARAFCSRGGYAAVAALGAVVRGETPHFDYVAGEAARGLMDLQIRFGVPVGFGVLTCDTLEQALARAGGAAGNKGHEAMTAALGAAQELARRHAGPR